MKESWVSLHRVSAMLCLLTQKAFLCGDWLVHRDPNTGATTVWLRVSPLPGKICPQEQPPTGALLPVKAPPPPPPYPPPAETLVEKGSKSHHLETGSKLWNIRSKTCGWGGDFKRPFLPVAVLISPFLRDHHKSGGSTLLSIHAATRHDWPRI